MKASGLVWKKECTGHLVTARECTCPKVFVGESEVLVGMTFVTNDEIPPGEIWFVDRDGNVITKVVGAA